MVTDVQMVNNLNDLLDQAEEGYMIPCRDTSGNVNLFAKSSSGDTLLHVAVGLNDLNSIKYLLNVGLDINARGDYFATPLFSAALSGNIALVGMLLKLGANPDIPDHAGKLPIYVVFSGLVNLPDSILERMIDVFKNP